MSAEPRPNRWPVRLLRLAPPALALLLLGPMTVHAHNARANPQPHQPFRMRPPAPSGEQWLVGFETGLRRQARAAIERHGADVEELLGAAKVYKVSAPPAAITKIQADDAVVFVEPDQPAAIDAVPDDPLYDDLWAMPWIHAPEAWDLTTGSDSVVVAVLDTGVQYDHPDLVDNIWVNPGEIDGNGIDDDGNGWVDDIHGADCISNDGVPLDGNGHGTHVAGSIGAVGNNGIGVVGVSWDVQIMPLRFLDSWGNGSISDAIECLDYAIEMGADIVNN
jgi:subtilisin family serine protease